MRPMNRTYGGWGTTGCEYAYAGGGGGYPYPYMTCQEEQRDNS